MKQDDRLEREISGIRDEAIDPSAVTEAAERVWRRLNQLRSCEDFQALMPEYRAGTLSEARALLLKDHTRDCIACRKALSGAKVREMPARAAERPALITRWAVAAGLAIAAGLAGWSYVNRSATTASRAVVESMNGSVYRVTNAGLVAVARGEELPGGVEIRTAKGSTAILRLGEGSRVEMRERSGISVASGWRKLTINLGGGSVIVQAEKNRSGALYVASRDCTTRVTGTTFSVNSGNKGSRVSVIEGEVRVTHAGRESVLHAGDQLSSNPSIGAIPVADEIAWSRNLDQHMALLKEFAALRKDLDALRMPGLRYQSKLIDLLPADTVVYASLPNAGRTLSEAYDIFKQRARGNPALQEWFDGMDRGGHVDLDEAITKIRTLSEYLGDEIVIAASMDENGSVNRPMFVAEVKREGFRDLVESQWPESKGHWTEQAGVVAISPDSGAVRLGGGFSGTEFYSRVRESFRDGAGVLFSADLERLTGRHVPREAKLAMGELRYVAIAQTEVSGRPEMRMTVGFDGTRSGIASWLGAPGPIRGLEFVSPEAGLVASITIKNPAQVIDDLFARLGSQDPRFNERLAEIESKLGISIRNDLAATLGSELTLAVDGPLLPVPSWKLIAEVYDAQRLQSTIQKLVEGINREATAEGHQGVTLTQEVAGGRIYYSLNVPEVGVFGTARYVFVDGFLIAAPNRQLIDTAIAQRASGYSLTRSQTFTSLLPRDRHASFSAVVYQNAASTMGPAVEALGGVMSPEQRQAAETLAKDLKPMLIAVYAEQDRITSATVGSMLGLGLGNFAGIQGPLDLLKLLPGKKMGTKQRGPA